jgi:hypothetical protein
MSSSYVQPRSLLGYEDFFRQSSSREQGWLEVKMIGSDEWSNKYVTLEDGELLFGDNEDALSSGEGYAVPMDRVISLRTDATLGDTDLALKTTDGKILLRATSKDAMNLWSFAFQKSVALVLTRIRERTSNDLITSSSKGDWTNDLGDGHGVQHSSVVRRLNMGRNTSSRCLTVEDISDHPWGKVDLDDLHIKNRLWAEDSPYQNRRSKSISSAIPINTPLVTGEQRGPGEVDLVGSYADSDDTNPLVAALRRAALESEAEPKLRAHSNSHSDSEMEDEDK